MRASVTARHDQRSWNVSLGEAGVGGGDLSTARSVDL